MSRSRDVASDDDIIVKTGIVYSDKDSSEEDLSVIPFARKALDYFNSKFETDFELLIDEPTDFGIFLSAKSILHFNFFAHSPASPSSSPSLFYAEVKTTSLDPDHDPDPNNEIIVFGCSKLLLVDSGNPLGLSCNYCSSESVIHPGPFRGYCVQLGDLFERSPFWKYAPLTSFNSNLYDAMFAENKTLYMACAEKAVHHLNSKAMAAMHEPLIQASPQSKSADFSHVTLEDATLKSICNWKLVKLVAAADRGGDPVHVNFEVVSRDVIGPLLCFAELFVPEEYAYGGWTTEKDHLLEIRGCCIMKKLESETSFGRVCSTCRHWVIHPGPAYDHCSVVGDSFDGSDFKRVGYGVF